jgi:RNA polymerase sigma-70 factor (ECF subfamily)
VAEALETTPASVYSALQRAHTAVDERLPERSQQATLRALGDERLRALVGEFVAAWERNDVDAVVALLTEDVLVAMPPRPTWFSGREAVAAFLAGRPLSGRGSWRLVPVRANGQPALGVYSRQDDRFVLHCVNVLTLRGDRIAELIAFFGVESIAPFRLPTELTGARSRVIGASERARGAR